MSQGSEDQGLSRRRFLGLGAVAAAASVLPAKALAAPVAKSGAPERVLSFFNTHTGERLQASYCCGGVYQPNVLEQVNFILRDFRANEIRPIDPKLLDLLYQLGGVLHTDQPYHVISGYRSPQTNSMLRTRRVPHGRGVGQPAHGREGNRHPYAGCQAGASARGSDVAEAGWRWLLPELGFRSRRHRPGPLLVIFIG